MTQTYKQIVLEKLRFGFNARFDRNDLRITIEDDFAINALIARIELFVAGKLNNLKTEYTYLPLDWWEAFKERWFPKWWLKKHPIMKQKIAIYTEYRMCPHLNINDQKHFHIDYLAGGEWLSLEQGDSSCKL